MLVATRCVTGIPSRTTTASRWRFRATEWRLFDMSPVILAIQAGHVVRHTTATGTLTSTGLRTTHVSSWSVRFAGYCSTLATKVQYQKVLVAYGWGKFNSRYCVDRARNLPGPATDNVLWVLQISTKSVHFRRSYSRTREHRRKMNPIFGWNLASSPLELFVPKIATLILMITTIMVAVVVGWKSIHRPTKTDYVYVCVYYIFFISLFRVAAAFFCLFYKKDMLLYSKIQTVFVSDNR